MADWNNETDSIVRECKLRTLRSKWNKASRGTTAVNGNQYNNLQNWIGGNVEVKVTYHCDESIVEHSVATQDIET